MPISYPYTEYKYNNKDKFYYDKINNAKVKVVDLTLRDAHQSLIATRMPFEVMEPVLDDMDKIGFHAVECWGGATFDSCIRFLNEDPWDRLRKFKKHFKNTKLQMLFRGQNILGYNHYADDVVEYFVKKSVSNGIDIIRIFDCLNDIRNLKTAIDASKKEGAHVQVAISYTLGEAYTIDYYKKLAKDIENMGADSICLKDMAGLLLPYEADRLVKAIKSVTKLPLEMHTHYTSGMASMSLMKSIEAGCDIIDTCLSPFALGTSHSATDVMIKALEGTEYDTMIDSAFAVNIATYFEKYKDDCIKSGLLNPKVLSVNVNTLRYQVPGGMLSNLISQLNEQGKLDKLQEVLEEVPRVRKDFGEPPLVTPSSQIVGTQSVLNVLSGERYKVVPKETKKLVKGEFGQTILPMNEEVVKKILGDEKRITDRPADHIAPQLKAFEEEMKQYKKQDEDVLTYALFPAVAKKFFESRR
ncbi:MAG: pyruvate carboxylase subunit B [Lachnospiraceae bacterium]|nr:pyruvate carboxylase subunit B [Lachnospiraceae bacterium]